MIKFYFLLILNFCLLINSNANSKQNLSIDFITERGIEIRYYLVDPRNFKYTEYIEIEGHKHRLYKSKDDAVNSIRNSDLKKDYTIVYVLSTTKKETEIISIED